VSMVCKADYVIVGEGEVHTNGGMGGTRTSPCYLQDSYN